MNIPAWVLYWAAVLGLATAVLGLSTAAFRGLLQLFEAWKKWEPIPQQVKALEPVPRQIEDLRERIEELEEERCHNSESRRRHRSGE